jgi:hypothetical protein
MRRPPPVRERQREKFSTIQTVAALILFGMQEHADPLKAQPHLAPVPQTVRLSGMRAIALSGVASTGLGLRLKAGEICTTS